MYVFVSALLFAMLMPTAPQRTEDGPACHAELRGLVLVTTVDLPSRVRVEGPWKLSHQGEVDEANGSTHFRMEAELDRVVQRDGVTGLERETRLGSPVRLVFEGTDQRDLVRRAAQVWCVTVMRAQENHALDQISPMQPKPVKIAAVAGASKQG